jgi:catabolite regulation protein CreA
MNVKVTLFSLLYLIMIALLLGCLLSLAGCAAPATVIGDVTPLGKWVKDDATAAKALADANGDAAGVTCYTSIESALSAIGAVAFTPGLLFGAELARVSNIQQSKVAAACAGIMSVSVVP